jgi:hypothetical protein
MRACGGEINLYEAIWGPFLWTAIKQRYGCYFANFWPCRLDFATSFWRPTTYKNLSFNAKHGLTLFDYEWREKYEKQIALLASDIAIIHIRQNYLRVPIHIMAVNHIMDKTSKSSFW